MNESDRHLVLDKLSLTFGGIAALAEVSLQVPRGSVVGIIGPNGAGKTSLLNCVNGFYAPTAGQISFDGKPIVGLPTHKITKLGIGRTFQTVDLIRDGTALANIMLGRHLHLHTNILSEALRWGPGQREETRHRERVEEIIEFLGITGLRKRMAGELSYGQQRLVEIGRALATEPSLLLLDEPTSGMNWVDKERVARLILRMRNDLKLTQILIEHDIAFISDLCDYVFVLNFGKLIAEGLPGDVVRKQDVVEAYLGTGYDQV